MDTITIQDLEVFFRVGVPEEERANPQRLLVTIVLEHDLRPAASSDHLGQTIDYHAVARRLLRFGEGRSWKLIETLAEEIAQLARREFKPRRVFVEIKKFVLPQTAYVAVRIER